MNSTLTVAIIGAISTIIASLGTVWLSNRSIRRIETAKTELAATTAETENQKLRVDTFSKIIGSLQVEREGLYKAMEYKDKRIEILERRIGELESK